MNLKRNKTILLVENESIPAKITLKTLQQEGFRAVHAASGEEAVDMAIRNNEINLVLMDIDLGDGIDGPEAARRILAVRDIPIVFLTSHSEKEYVERVKKITRYGYVVKDSGSFVLFSSIEMAFELNQAHQQVASSEERFRQLAESTETWIWETDANGLFVYSNSVVERILGYTPGQIIQKKHFHDFFPRSQQMSLNLMALQHYQAGGGDHKFECVVNHRNGNRVMIESSGFPIIGKNGAVTGYRGVNVDVTEKCIKRKCGLIYSEFQNAVAEIRSIPEVLTLVVATLTKLLGDSINIVSYLDESTQTLQIADFNGLKKPISKLIQILGLDPRKHKIHVADITPEELDMYRSGKLELLENGLYVLFARKVSQKVCDAVGSFLNIRNVYAVGFTNRGRHFGGIIILTRQELNAEISTIERMAGYAAIAIKRLEAESASLAV
ncbi:MAG: PAS domain S-box protein [Leptospiraceae bacterium]|nr:PAS domain S-box protein [Leptospiraceae bacterium]